MPENMYIQAQLSSEREDQKTHDQLFEAPAKATLSVKRSANVCRHGLLPLCMMYVWYDFCATLDVVGY